MKDIFSHHAYVVSASPEETAAVVAHIEKTTGIKAAGNPDVWQTSVESFSIGEARELVLRASRKPLTGGQQYFVVGFYFATTEAQNALLKLLEDPTGESVFFLVTPSPEHLLPTLRSRLQPLALPHITDKKQEPQESSLAKKFIAADIGERFEMMEDMIEGKEKVSAIDFLNALEAALAPRAAVDGGAGRALTEIMRCRDYLHDRAPSVKMLLEHIALITPIAP